MVPFLFEFHAFGTLVRVPSYGVFLAAAFSLSYFLTLRRARLLGEKLRDMENIFFLSLFGSIIGARGFHVFLEDRKFYMGHPEKIIAFWEGGYTFYGAVIVSLLLIFFYCKARRLSFLQMADIVTPAALFGLFIGRIGCFLAGCCWGSETHVPWAVTFSHPETFSGLKNVPLHPAQLYEAAGAFLLFVFLNKRYKKRKYLGQLFFEGLGIYAILRIGVECFRGDEYRGFLGGVSYSQIVSLLILPISVVGGFLFSRTRMNEEARN